MKFIPVLLAAALFSIATSLANDPILLWPNGAPGVIAATGDEHDTTKPDPKAAHGKSIIRLGEVSKPSITLFPAKPENATGAAVIVCPGGGYNILAWDLEGTEICEWLNSIGVTGVLLKYRVPAPKTGERFAPALQDAQRAISLVRSHAKEWKINPERIGVLGFSAGGHLSAALSTSYEKHTYEPIDDADKVSARPDFAVLVYPAYLTSKEQPEIASPELKLTVQTPPTFLVQTQDDKGFIESTLFYYLALKRAGVPAELHLYPNGGHGYGLRPSDKNVSSWPQRVADWMRALGMLAK